MARRPWPGARGVGADSGPAFCPQGAIDFPSAKSRSDVPGPAVLGAGRGRCGAAAGLSGWSLQAPSGLHQPRRCTWSILPFPRPHPSWPERWQRAAVRGPGTRPPPREPRRPWLRPLRTCSASGLGVHSSWARDFLKSRESTAALASCFTLFPGISSLTRQIRSVCRGSGGRTPGVARRRTENIETALRICLQGLRGEKRAWETRQAPPLWFSPPSSAGPRFSKQRAQCMRPGVGGHAPDSVVPGLEQEPVV